MRSTCLFHAFIRGALIAISFAGMGTAFAQTSVAIGTCIIVNQNIKLEKGATLTVENNDCTSQSPEKSYILKFIWVDSKNISYIASSYHDSALRAVLGNSPIFFKNQVYATLTELVKSFGLKPEPNSTFFGETLENTIQTANRTASSPYDLSSIPAAQLRKIQFYAGEQLILWPDISASRIIKDSAQWPPSYSLTYAPRTNSKSNAVKPSDIRFGAGNTANAIASIFNCTVLYKNVSKTEFDGYWENLEKVEQLILASSANEQFFLNAELLDFRRAVVSNPSVEAIRYLTSKGWPDDFLIAAGNFSVRGCGSDLFGFYAVPRRLYALLAVIEPKGSTLTIDGASFLTDGHDAIRLPPSTVNMEEARFSPITVRRGESFVIPLQIELRYDTDEFPISAIQSNASSPQFYSAINKAPAQQFSYSLEWETDAAKKSSVRIVKNKSEFKPPVFQNIERKYVFGKFYDLTALYVDGKKVETRKTPRAAVVMYGKFEGGSCPFLYFRDAAGSLYMRGRILVGAVGADREREERIPISKGMMSFIVKEHEPEVTFVKKVSLFDPDTGEEQILGRNFYLGVDKAIEFEIPERFRDRGLIRIAGYYKTLSPEEVIQRPLP